VCLTLDFCKSILSGADDHDQRSAGLFGCQGPGRRLPGWHRGDLASEKKSNIAEADGYSEAWQQQVLKHFVKN